MKKEIRLIIKNTCNPLSIGTIIGNGNNNKASIKSVAYSRDIACIKVHGAGIGYKPGVLTEITSFFSSNKINIKSVMTSQTCITILLEKKDLNRSYNILAEKKIETVEEIKKIKDIALIAIIGKEISNHNGIVSKIFTAITNRGINIEFISAGASEAAFYLIIKERCLQPALKAIHKELRTFIAK
jgi:aspartate kinase